MANQGQTDCKGNATKNLGCQEVIRKIAIILELFIWVSMKYLFPVIIFLIEEVALTAKILF